MNAKELFNTAMDPKKRRRIERPGNPLFCPAAGDRRKGFAIA
jgi:hypothetical protein